MKSFLVVVVLCFVVAVFAKTNIYDSPTPHKDPAPLGVGVPKQPTWTQVSKSVEGMLLSADVDSIRVGQLDGIKDVVVFGIMKYSGKEYLPPFVALIDVKDCVEHGKGTLYNVFFDNTTQEQAWSLDGSTMNDAQGSFLCGFLKEVLKSRQPNNDTKHERKYFI